MTKHAVLHHKIYDQNYNNNNNNNKNNNSEVFWGI